MITITKFDEIAKSKDQSLRGVIATRQSHDNKGVRDCFASLAMTKNGLFLTFCDSDRFKTPQITNLPPGRRPLWSPTRKSLRLGEAGGWVKKG